MMKSKISTESTVLVNSISMCINQDVRRCLTKGRRITPVTETASYKSNGKNGVKTGDVSGCGATLISGSVNTKTN